MITILMTTYNGEAYLREQLDSLLNQTVLADRIVISDDGSTDRTVEIIEEYRVRFPEQIVLRKNSDNRGAIDNFFGLMCTERDDYIMLADQDDIWLPKKIEISLHAIKEQEMRYGTQMPLLAHTDLTVVDEALRIVSASYCKRMHLDLARTQLKDMIIQNTLTGCTAMYNRALGELLTAQPAYCVMHDWWLMLVAVSFGHVVTVYDQTVLYRQHEKNVVGSKNVRSVSYVLKRAFMVADVKKSVNESYAQAKCFLKMYGDKLSQKQRKFLEDYSSIPEYGKCKRMYEIYRLGIRKNGILRRIGQFIYA